MNQSFFGALLPIIFLITLLSFNVYLYGDDSLGGANQLALLQQVPLFKPIMAAKAADSKSAN
jgi:hypothetical protein